MGYKRQRELICANCPLMPDCDEQHLFCMYRWLTDPNDAQKEALKLKATVRQKGYQRDYYLANQDRIKAERKAKYHAERSAARTATA